MHVWGEGEGFLLRNDYLDGREAGEEDAQVEGPAGRGRRLSNPLAEHKVHQN